MVIQPDDIDIDAAMEGLMPAFDVSDVHTCKPWIMRCMNDKAQLWKAGPLWAITEVMETKAGRALHIVAMAGTYNPKLLEEMESWGVSVGCKKSYFTGRMGWIKKVPQYRPKTVTMEKELKCQKQY